MGKLEAIDESVTEILNESLLEESLFSRGI
jgi:hypothetical protein